MTVTRGSAPGKTDLGVNDFSLDLRRDSARASDPNPDAAVDAFLAGCSDRVRARLQAVKSYRSFRPGQEILAEGEESRFVGVVVNGVVRLSKSLADGRRQTVSLRFPTQFVGRPLRPVMSYDAAAVTAVRLCLFPRAEFDAIMRTSHSLSLHVLELLFDKLDEAQELLLIVGRMTGLERVASYLLMMARREAALRGALPEDGMGFDLMITRMAIADHLGLTPETVCRMMAELQELEAIKVVERRNVYVLRHRALLEAAGQDADGDPAPGPAKAGATERSPDRLRGADRPSNGLRQQRG